MANNEATSTVGTLMAFSLTPPPTLDIAGFTDAAVVYTDWDRLSNVGDVGAELDIFNWTPVGSGVEESVVTTLKNGEQDMEAADVPNNPGQQLFVGAVKSRTTLTVRETFPTGEVWYYRAIPRSARKKVGDASGAQMLSPKMKVTGEIVEDLTGVPAD